MNTVGSIQKWLTFGLSADQEDRFRQANFSANVAKARICIFLLILPIVGFVVNDYGFFRLSWTFYELLALRFALLAYTRSSRAYLDLQITSPTTELNFIGVSFTHSSPSWCM
jgi:hypothetical protein